MHIENVVFMEAETDAICALACAVEEWPRLLPHYRWVKVLADDGSRRIVEMAAWRGRIPVHWVAEQRCLAEEPRITFRHIGGVTTGMDVAWEFVPRDHGVDVRIVHDLDLRWPLIGTFAAQRIIGPYFVSYIANRTLQRFKQIVETAKQPLAEGVSR